MAVINGIVFKPIWYHHNLKYMVPDQSNDTTTGQPANTGNASNPSAEGNSALPNNDQLLNDKAEKYLREAGNIEDMPDDQDQQQMDADLDTAKRQS